MKLLYTSEKAAGISASVLAYVLWGLFPIYWKMLHEATAYEAMAHRVVWCFLFLSVGIIISKQKTSILCEIKELLAEPKRALYLVICAVLISVNWLTYIWAVNANRIIETSFGYYINPLVTVLLGILVLNERLSFWHTISFALAAFGVANMIFQLGSLPWVSLVLALSFGLYGLYKKMVKLGSVTGIAMETLILSPLALTYLLYLNHNNTGAFTFSHPALALLLASTGIITAIPLILFSYGMNRLPLSVAGFIQYFSPTMSLLVGVFIYHENFSKGHFVSFSFIWAALIIFSLAKTPPFAKLESTLIKKLIASDKLPLENQQTDS